MTCAACEREDVNALNAELLEGRRPIAVLAEFYEVSQSVLIRHKYEHLTAVVQKARTDPLSIVQSLINYSMELEGRMGIGAAPFLRGEESARDLAEKVNDRAFAMLGWEYRTTLMSIAKLTGAQVTPDWRDQIPQWNQMLKVLLDFATELPPAQRDKLYLTLEAVDKIGSSGDAKKKKKG